MAEKHYDAFISYRHSELDRFVAEKLQHAIEYYRLPRSVRKENKNIGKNRIGRLFRDKDELPLASNLSDPIILALKNSDYLIVICTPRLPQSEWCKLEIDTFIATHGRDHVLAVLAEGEPEDSFPQQLLHYDREVTLEDGTTKWERVRLEPLAADVRGKNKAEVAKKIKTECLRILAVMFEVGFADLRQKHREEKMRKALGISLFITTACVAFGAISWSMLMMIQQQAELLEEQKLDLQESNKKIQDQYMLSLSQNEVQVAEIAMNKASEGKRQEAVEMLLDVMPESSTDTEVPFVSEANCALTDILYTYETGSHLQVMNTYSCSTYVDYTEISPNGELLAAIDEAGEIYIYDLCSEELIYRASTKIENADDKDMGFLDDNRFYYLTDELFIVHDISEDVNLMEYQFEDFFYNPLDVMCNDEYVICASDQSVHVFRKDSLDEVFTYNCTDMTSIEGIMVSYDSNYFVYYEKDYENELYPFIFHMISTETFEETCAVPFQCYDVDELRVYDEKLVISSIVSDVDMDQKMLSCYDAITGECCWTRQEQFYYTDNMFHSMAWERNNLLVVSGRNVYEINLDDGTDVAEYSFTDDVLQISSLSQNGNYCLWCSDGCYYIWDTNTSNVTGYPFLGMECESEIIGLKYGNEGYAVMTRECKEILFYGYAKGANVEQISEEDYSMICASPDGSMWAGYCYDTDAVEVFDVESNELLYHYSNAGTYVPYGISFVEDSTHLLILEDDSNEPIVLLNITNGDIETRECDALDGYAYTQISEDGSKFIVWACDYVSIVNVLDETESTITDNEIIETIFLSNFVLSNDMEHVAWLDEEESEIHILDITTQSIDVNIPVDQVNVRTILFCENAGYLLVEYKDATTEIYDIQDGSLRKTFYGNYTFVERMEYVESINEFLIFSIFGSSVVDESFSIVENIDYLAEYVPNNDCYILSDVGTYIVPKCDYDDLIESAEDFLSK